LETPANVGNGAQTRWANFFHGIFLLFSILFAVPFIEMIPNAALAAMLIFVGFRLTHPKEYQHMWHIGKEQFLIFVATIIITLSTDLLIGVATGIVLELIVNTFNGATFKSLFKADLEVEVVSENISQIHVKNALLFSNNLGLKKIISDFSPSETVIVNCSKAKLIDHSSLTLLHELAHDFKNSAGLLSVVGLDKHKQLGSNATSTYKLN
jgi:MFS superfamily sulfate permease-like transporter